MEKKTIEYITNGLIAHAEKFEADPEKKAIVLEKLNQFKAKVDAGEVPEDTDGFAKSLVDTLDPKKEQPCPEPEKEPECMKDRKANWADITAMFLAVGIVIVVVYMVLGHFLNL